MRLEAILCNPEQDLKEEEHPLEVKFFYNVKHPDILNSTNEILNL